MLVSFTGAQSTGKSTLLQKMLCSDDFRKCSFVKEVTRKVAANGHNINDKGDDTTQLFILSEHLNNHMLGGCTVLDRCIIDGMIYTEWLHAEGKVSEWVVRYARDLHDHLISKLDVVLYPDPADVKLVADGQRSNCHKFRNDIISLYDKYFEEHPQVKDRTVILRGGVDERLKQIHEQLKHYDKTR